MPDSDFKIETRAVTVDISFGGGQRLRGDVFLHRGAAQHRGDETIVDLVNAPEPFFPVRAEGPNGLATLVAKSQIRYVLVPSLAADARIAVERQTAANRVDVAIVLDDGEELSGAAYVELPPGRQRLLDFVNASDRFFVLVQSGGDCLVNRAHVRTVREKTG